MRASTMFLLIIAILLGLGVTIAAKQAGLFDKPQVQVVKEPPIQVLVAATNLFETTALTAKDVRVRDLKPSELEHYKQHKDQYLPAVASAANLRVMARNLAADEPLLKEHFTDLALPGTYTERISPHMRAIDIGLPRERAGGGLLRLGEHVDVMLTAQICDTPDCKHPITRTAVIARDAKIIVKRNSLFTVMQSDPENALISYTLEVNPYRRALIEYAKQKGTLSLAPAPSTQPRSPAPTGAGGTPSFSDPTSKEYKDEDKRVAAISKGDLTVGDEDLERIFDVKPKPPPVPPVTIQMISGVKRLGTVVFPPNSDREGVLETPEPPLSGQRVSSAAGATQTGSRFLPAPKDCPGCDKKKKDLNQK